MPLIAPEVTARLITLQSLDDAIKQRFGLLDLDCEIESCSPGHRCTSHDDDERMLSIYRQRHASEFRKATAQLDPHTVTQIMKTDGNEPLTVRITAAAILSHLRQLAKDGTILADIAGEPALFEPIDGQTAGQIFAEHPLTSTEPRGSST